MDHPTKAPEAAPRFGFWRRLFAALIDTILLLIVGLAFSPLGDQLMVLGQKGKLIGLAISLLYFGVLNSGLGGGATLGKRVLGLRVVGRDGAPIALWRAVWRTLVYLLPFYVYQLDPQQFWVPEKYAHIASGIATFINIGGVFAIVYLYLFNARTRQSLHDILAGTFVLRTDRAGEPVVPRIRPMHLVVSGIVFALTAAVTVTNHYVNIGLPDFGLLPGKLGTLSRLAAVAAEEPSVNSANANQNTTYFHSTSNGKNEQWTTLAITALVRTRPANPNAVIAAVGKRVLTATPDALGSDKFCVQVKWGYDIGIGSYWDGKQNCDTPTAWHEAFKPAMKERAAPATAKKP